MKILIASDSFKHCLSSLEVGENLRKGILIANPDWDVQVCPVADGGEGTLDAIISSVGGEIIKATVHDPLMRPVEARFGVLNDGITAIIEMASASGIELLKEQEPDPLRATSYGTGELIIEALDKGCRRIIVSMGGSATNDGGSGMLVAMGARFLDENGEEIQPGGAALKNLIEMNLDGLDERLKECEIIAATDVGNPLLGPSGATMVYSGQKGDDEHASRLLEAAMNNFAEITLQQTGKDVSAVPGTGAAGGLGFGLKAILDAQILFGFDLVARMTGLASKIEAADLVITGEGRIDKQTRFGKTPMGVARLAKASGKPVIAVSGALGTGYRELYKEGIMAIFALPDKPMTLSESLSRAPELLTGLGEKISSVLMINNHS